MVTYVLNIFKSILCCLDIRKLQMIFTSQIVLDPSLCKGFVFFVHCLPTKHTRSILLNYDSRRKCKTKQIHWFEILDTNYSCTKISQLRLEIIFPMEI